PGARKGKGTTACQRTSGRAQAFGAVRWGTRVIWRKLDRLNPNVQKVQVERPPERRLKPAPRPTSDSTCVGCNLRSAERCPTRVFKDMSGAPTSRCHVQLRRTWDRLSDASPMATQCP